MVRRLAAIVLLLSVVGLTACTSVSDIGNPPEVKGDHERALVIPSEATAAAGAPVINLQATAPPASPIGAETAALPTVAASPAASPRAAAVAAVSSTAGPTPRPAPPAVADRSKSVMFYHGTSGRREVALTFDAGADRGNAAKILDILEHYNVKGTIGLTGEWAKANPDLVKRMVADGDMLINHTWNHQSFTGESDGLGGLDHDQRVQELVKTQNLIKQLTGYHLQPYFRPPYADYDDSTLTDVASAGYDITVMWSCDTMGWNGATVHQIIAKCTDPSFLKPGEIILMHVGAASQDAAALPQMIEDIQAKGYQFVTVEQILQP